MASRPRENVIRIEGDDDPRIPRRLMAYLKQEIALLEESILQGQLTKGEYKFSTGRLQGLQAALDESKRIAEEL